jgi:tetratricopeptide (TPR) repeat protein
VNRIVVGVVLTLEVALIGAYLLARSGLLQASADAQRGIPHPPVMFFYPQAPPITPVAIAYLAKVDAADAIADPLQRCLAYPDLPGNHWQAGVAEAYCRWGYHGPQHVTLDLIEDHIRHGTYASLDAIFMADLERHFSKTDFSEDIHYDYDQIQPDARTELATRNWLDKDAQSAYALSARASYFRKAGERARGEGWASEVPPEKMQRMHDLLGKAATLYQKALRIEPRLMPAYAGLINVGMYDSREELRTSAFEAAQRLDPACDSVIRFEMTAREPRWGGSYEQMQALESAIVPYIKSRPLLGLYIGSAEADRGEMLSSTEHYAEAAAVLSKISKLTPAVPPCDCLAISMLHLGNEALHWDDIISVIAAARYDSYDKDSNLNRGTLLVRFRRTDLGLRYLKRASAIAPNEGDLHMYVSEAYRVMKNDAAADEEARLALSDPKTRQHALGVLSVVFASHKKWAEAKQQVDLLTHEYPNDAQGWLYRYDIYKGLHDKAEALAAIKKYLSMLDPSDPANKTMIEFYKPALTGGEPLSVYDSRSIRH